MCYGLPICSQLMIMKKNRYNDETICVSILQFVFSFLKWTRDSIFRLKLVTTVTNRLTHRISMPNCHVMRSLKEIKMKKKKTTREKQEIWLHFVIRSLFASIIWNQCIAMKSRYLCSIQIQKWKAYIQKIIPFLVAFTR